MSDEILRAEGSLFYNVERAVSAQPGRRDIRRIRKEPIYVTTSPVSSPPSSSPGTVAPSTTDAATTTTTSAPSTSAATSVASADPNSGLDPTDHGIAAQSIGMEIALRDLIHAADGDETMQQLGAAHEAFATRIAGISGIPANTADAAYLKDHEAAFASDPTAAAQSAEFEAAEKYIAWMGQISDGRLITAFASISVSESRLGALLAMGSGLETALDGSTGAES